MLRLAYRCGSLFLSAALAAQSAAAPAADEALRAQFARYFAADADGQRGFAFDRELDHELTTAAGDARLRALVWQALQDHERTRFAADHAARIVRCGGLESAFTLQQVGERPANGWPLVIAMHGGGGVPQAVNDAQWRHMQVYYRAQPQVGGYLYCALRAPNDAWNGFYFDGFYPLLETLIRQFVVCDAVDPDRVIAIGYSHGGYGAFAVGPKLPHRFAAVHASAAAPTDGESSPVGLHTLPFSWMVGGEDTAYGRRERCEAFAARIDALRREHVGFYPATFTLVEGNGHTGLPDRDCLAQLVPNVRAALPKQVWWEATDAVVQHHYWLCVPAPRKRLRIDAVLEGQRLSVRWCDHAALDSLLVGADDAAARERHVAATLARARAVEAEVWLDARLVDLTQPLAVTVAVADDLDVTLVGSAEMRTTPTFTARAARRVEPAPSLRTLCATMQQRGDPVLAASWILELH